MKALSIACILLLTVVVRCVAPEEIRCATGVDDEGNFEVETFVRNASFIPVCYIFFKTRDFESQRRLYGAADYKQLPHKCAFQPFFTRNFLVISIFAGEGSIFCCPEDRCNLFDDRITFDVRHMGAEISPRDHSLYIAAFLLIITAYPTFLLFLSRRNAAAIAVAERAHVVYDVWPTAVVTKDEQMLYSISPRFDSTKVFHRTLRHLFKPGQYEDPCNSENDACLTITPQVIVVQQDESVCRRIIRPEPSKHHDLARRLIEHGPFEYDFDPVEVGDLFDLACDVLLEEPVLLEIPSGVFIYGNVEGNYADLFRFFQMNGFPPESKVLFLGGFTSSDSLHNLETIVLLFSLKLMLPNHVYLLRGVSEVNPIKLGQRFSLRTRRYLSTVIDQACTCLPIAAVVASNILCVHGGVPTMAVSRDDIRALKRPMFRVPRGSVEADVIFGIPSIKLQGPIPGVRGRYFNPDSSKDQTFLRTLQCEFLVTSRCPVPTGYKFLGNKSLLLWSAIVPLESYGKRGSTENTVSMVSSMMRKSKSLSPTPSPSTPKKVAKKPEAYTSAASLHIHENATMHLVRIVKYVEGYSVALPPATQTLLTCRRRYQFFAQQKIAKPLGVGTPLSRSVEATKTTGSREPGSKSHEQHSTSPYKKKKKEASTRKSSK